MKRVRTAGCVVVGLVAVMGCSQPELPENSYFNENVEPVIRMGCVQQTTGCHLGVNGTAAGNIDLSSYDSLMRRRDVLPAYGPYPVGLILLKAGDPVDVQVDTIDPPDPAQPDVRAVTIHTDVRHNAGRTLALSSSAYSMLKQWIAGGFTRTSAPPPPTAVPQGHCRQGAGSFAGFDPSAPPIDDTAYTRFVNDVQPILLRRCAGEGCHASSIADMYISCGQTDEEKHWNFFVALSHVNEPTVESEMLRRPLDTLRGGTFHEGGNVFLSTEDPDYQTIKSWADEIEARRPEILRDTDLTDGFRFFVNRVEPLLVRKGCMFLNCHSPEMFHDLRLRTGSQGTFSRIAMRRNYNMARLLLAIESPNPNQSRIIAKNLYPNDFVRGGEGITHRGGSLLEDFVVSSTGDVQRATPDRCVGVDADHGDLNTIPAYCVFVRWHRIERDAAIAAGDLMPDSAPVSSVVYVARPSGVGSSLDFDTYRPGADLRVADAMVAADGSVSLAPTTRSLLGTCGLTVATADIRGPAVSWDAQKIAFAARSAASSPLRLYTMNVDGTMCARLADVAPSMDSENDILTHDFDPAFAPDGRIVFASTRGNLDRSGFPWTGPTRTPAAMAPNANLYVYEPSSSSSVRQLTFLLNQEVSPGFMTDGRVIMTAEKREPDFHQLAGRRMNLDGGDYHPLFGQRPSIGFASATEIVELPNRNLALVASTIDAVDGAGAIAIVNRSIGPDQNDRDPGDRAYIHSMHLPAPGALGGGMGAFRSPTPLPNGHLIVSCALSATSLTAGTFDFDLCDFNPYTGETRVVLTSTPGQAFVEAAAVYSRRHMTSDEIFHSRIDEVNSRTSVDPSENDAQVNIQDIPLLGTLMFANTRTGRPIDHDVAGLDILADYPPPASAHGFGDVGANVVSDAFGQVFLDRHMLGHVNAYADGSAKIRFRGGMPIVLRLTDASSHALMFGAGGPFTGEMVQREEMQFYPGERANQVLPRRFFDNLCAGCHGSITGRELDIAASVDILTSASRAISRDVPPTDFFQ